MGKPSYRTVARSALLALTLATGCYAYKPVSTAPAPESRVRIVLREAMTISTFAPESANVRHDHPGVLEASGTIQAASSDTVALRLGELRTAGGTVPNVSRQVAILPADRIARMEQRRFQAGTTILVAFAAAAVALTIFIVAITGTIIQGI